MSISRVDAHESAFTRASLLRASIAGAAGLVAGGALSSLADASAERPATASELESGAPTIRRPRVLLAYFSRPGENYYYGGRTNLKVGNTEVLAGMISKHIRCDMHRIKPANAYPVDYEETVARNVREQNANARPRIANPLLSIDDYDVVLLASPIWNVRPPMIMSTFAIATTSPARPSSPSSPTRLADSGRRLRITPPPVKERGSDAAWRCRARRCAAPIPQSERGCAESGWRAEPFKGVGQKRLASARRGRVLERPELPRWPCS